MVPGVEDVPLAESEGGTALCTLTNSISDGARLHLGALPGVGSRGQTSPHFKLSQGCQAAALGVLYWNWWSGGSLPQVAVLGTWITSPS